MRRLNLLRCFLKWSLQMMALVALLSACRRKMIVLKSPPGYNFAIASKFKLDVKLREISGIGWDRKKDYFIAETDESDQIYMLDKDSKNIIGNKSLGAKGDYEDLALADSIPYILRSDGTIFRFNSDSSQQSAREVAKLELQGASEFETMYYDADRKALVIVCKNCSMDDEEGKVSAFAYYVDSSGFANKPIFQIDRKAINKLAPQKDTKFQPSAAAINPRQKKLYILSSVSHQLAIADLDGNVEGVYVLTPSLFPQPEGICFKGNGDMYISNEGGTGLATMLKFTYTETNLGDTSAQGKKLGYNFLKPDDKMELGKHLHEISGMSWVKDKNMILAENDEKGDIYTVDFKNKSDNFHKTKFGGHGDYEDIVHTDTADYLLVSSGSVVQVIIKDSVVASSTEYSLGLEKSEFETLYLDAADRSLVMLCKQCQHEKEKIRNAYRFDLVTHKFSPDPAYTIDIGIIRQKLNDETAEFKPSAAAINPITGKLFIVASVGKLLVVADKKGNVEQIFRLDPALFNQPEGMTFAPNGDLYISNEGGEGIATILKFAYKP